MIRVLQVGVGPLDQQLIRFLNDRPNLTLMGVISRTRSHIR